MAGQRLGRRHQHRRYHAQENEPVSTTRRFTEILGREPRSVVGSAVFAGMVRQTFTSCPAATRA